MKKTLLCLLALVAIVVAGCKNYDDDIDALDKRVTALEEWQKTVNTNISSLQTIVDALQKKDYVTSVTTLADGTGYQISFQNSGSITIKNGTNGKDGTTPVIGVDKYTDGNYYWTIDTGSGAKWLKDASGNMIRTTGDKGATGAAGKDAISPQLRINSDTNVWEISTDGGKTWTSTGVNATGATGAQGDAVFAKDGVTVGTETVTFTLADGKTTFEIPLNQGMRIAANIHDDIVMISGEKLLSVSLPASMRKDDFTSILAEVKCVSGTSIDMKTRTAATANTWGVTLADLYYTVIPITTWVTVTPPTSVTADNRTALLVITLCKKDGTTVIASRTLMYQAMSYNSVGAGTEASPYLIYNAEQLVSLSTAVQGDKNMQGVYFKMMNDIDLSGVCYNVDGTPANDKSWTPIGSLEHNFNGVFDGNGYSVKGLYINAPFASYQGLFGYTEHSSAIKNLTISGSLTGGRSIGSIVGWANGSISKCHSSVVVTGKDFQIGGIVGYMIDGPITECSNTGNISSKEGVSSQIGGVVGTLDRSSMTGCYNTGNVNGGDKSMEIGGVVGDIVAGSTMTACYNTGNVTASNSYAIGGVAGAKFTGTITACYNTGSVSGSTGSIGGILGSTTESLATIVSSYTTISSMPTVGSPSGTDGQVANISTLNGEVWDMNNAIKAWNTANSAKVCNYHYLAWSDTEPPMIVPGTPD